MVIKLEFIFPSGEISSPEGANAAFVAAQRLEIWLIDETQESRGVLSLLDWSQEEI